MGFENAGGEIKADSKQTEMSVARQVMSNHSTSVTESKNENYDKIMKSQRSMRRGSGAGSPNSQLSIPRCPAFDFSEQEDVQSLFPSPSEPEGYHNIKTDVHGTQIGETENDSLLSSSRLKDPSLKKRDSSKSKTLMPELMENSETESAKGSFECEAPDLPISVEAPSVPMPDIAFPSLPNTFLAKLGVHKDSPLPVEAFDEQELESKFIALSLAFKTDRTTLNKRLELHKRQRDMAEKNVENEFHAMREHLNALNLKATSSDIRDFISKILNHLDIAQQATSRVSGRSETFGAVQQEERVCRAFEVLVLHVDHLKRLFDKEHKELEETRKMLSDTQAFRKDFDGDSVSEDQKKYLKTFGLPVGSMKSVFSLSSLLSVFRPSCKAGRRGASAADFHQHSLPESFRTPNFSFSWTSDCAVQNVGTQQCASSLFPTASSVGLSSSSLPTSPVTSISSSKIRTLGTSFRSSSSSAADLTVPHILPNPESTSCQSDQNLLALSSDNQNFRIKERNSWTKKLSAVTDEKEQTEDEIESLKIDSVASDDNETKTKKRYVRLSSLKQVESERIASYETDYEISGDAEVPALPEAVYLPSFCSDDDDAAAAELGYFPSLWNAFGNWLSTSALYDTSISAICEIESRIAYICYIVYIWAQNSVWNRVRFIGSTLFIFIFSFFFILSIFSLFLVPNLFNDPVIADNFKEFLDLLFGKTSYKNPPF